MSLLQLKLNYASVFMLYFSKLVYFEINENITLALLL
jgi:hypothetical protein